MQEELLVSKNVKFPSEEPIPPYFLVFWEILNIPGIVFTYGVWVGGRQKKACWGCLRDCKL